MNEPNNAINLQRLLVLDLPPGQAAFLWGARKTGKSTYLKAHFPDAVYYDLLKSDLQAALIKNPHEFREEILALPAEKRLYPVIVDEVQKVPSLLDEIHWLIEHASISFILCGSNARKLKRGAANLLGGRAWRFNFYPLVYPEIPDFDLLRALNSGLIPSHYLSPYYERSLRAYVHDYLYEEIRAEALTRNLPAFARFLDAVAFSHGELINYSNIARDCAISAKTVQEYYHILEDTLIGYFIPPFVKKQKRDIITHTPKFYLFDVGLVNQLIQRKCAQLKGAETGKNFEHFIILEIIAYRGLSEKEFQICFWRTKTKLEVDVILGQGEVAIEIKLSADIKKTDLAGLVAFQEEHGPREALVVCQVPRARRIEVGPQHHITLLPWQEFLQRLWAHDIL